MTEPNYMPDAVREVFDSLKGDRTLFGSRSMAARPATSTFDPAEKIAKSIYANTDYDISAEFTQENIDILQSMGFTGVNDIDKLYVRDDLTRDIFKKMVSYSSESKFFSNVIEVQVILRVNNTLFMDVWDRITPEFYYNNLWKRGPGVKRHRKGTTAMKEYIKDTMNRFYKSSLTTIDMEMSTDEL